MVQTSDFIDSAFLANTTFSDNAYMSKLFRVTETDEHTGAMKPLSVHNMWFGGFTLG